MLGGHERFAFDYDFGDGWEHDVVIEKRSPSSVAFAECLDGQNACPPDDVGGPGGYEDFLAALADPAHEAHDADPRVDREISLIPPDSSSMPSTPSCGSWHNPVGPYSR